MIDIVIVNWNTGSLLFECLGSVSKARYGGLIESVVVVDNASTDDSLDRVEIFDFITIVRNSKNIGFGAACNIGASKCSSEFTLFLNPDSRISSASIRVPHEFMLSEEGKDSAVCGVQLLDDLGRVSRSCAYYPTPLRIFFYSVGLDRLKPFESYGLRMSDWDHSHNNSVGQVIGAFFFCRRSIFEDMRGFDERFFVYFEEVDYCYRVKAAGLDVNYLVGANAIHIGGGSSRKVRSNRLFYSLRSRIKFAFKHFTWAGKALVVFASIFIEPFCRVLLSLARGDTKSVGATLLGYGYLVKYFVGRK